MHSMGPGYLFSEAYFSAQSRTPHSLNAVQSLWNEITYLNKPCCAKGAHAEIIFVTLKKDVWAEQAICLIYLCFFPPWLRVQFITAPANHLQLVFWGESWSKPHFKTASSPNGTHGNGPWAEAQKTLFGGSACTRRVSHTIQMSIDILWSLT